MLAQQRDVAAVGAEHDVEGVAGERHGADRAFEDDVGHHAREQSARHAEAVGLVQQIAGQRGGSGVADAGHQPQQRLDAEADVGAGQHERRVEHGGEPVEPIKRRAARVGVVAAGGVGLESEKRVRACVGHGPVRCSPSAQMGTHAPSATSRR